MNEILLAIFLSAGSTQGLPPKLLESVCYVESHYDIEAIHHDDGGSSSLGVCQIKLSTARWLGFNGKARDLMKPENNVLYAAKYLKHNLNKYKGNIAKAVISYNRGNAKDLTSTKYSRKVMRVYKNKLILEPYEQFRNETK